MGDVPYGLGGIRGDLETWWRVEGARTAWDRVRVVLLSRALWGLAYYRFGRWVYLPGATRARLVRRGCRLFYRMLQLWVSRLCKVSLPVQAEIGGDVWLASHDTIRVGPGARIGHGSRLHGGNTLGAGGRPPHRGVPRLGDRVVLAPGAVLVGPLTVVDDVIVGPNSAGSKSIEMPGAYCGSPLRPWNEDPRRLVPAGTGGTTR